MASISQKGAILECKKGGKVAVIGLYIRKSNNIGCQALFKAKNGGFGGFGRNGTIPNIEFNVPKRAIIT